MKNFITDAKEIVDSVYAQKAPFMPTTVEVEQALAPLVQEMVAADKSELRAMMEEIGDDWLNSAAVVALRMYREASLT